MLDRPRLRVIDEDQIRKIHDATAHVLEKTGIRITQETAREIISGDGARVEKDRVHIPRQMLEDAIEKAPSRVVLGNRRGEEAIVLERMTHHPAPLASEAARELDDMARHWK